ncbi:uncharacterized protein DEA37_0009092, partial [Paragonimus westermani]
LLTCYEHWIDRVKRDVPADRPLVFQVRNGWKPLCEFLSVPVPTQPFPKADKRAELVTLLTFWCGMMRLVRWEMCSVVSLLVVFVLFRLF